MSPEHVSIVIPHYGDSAPTLQLVDALHTQRGAPAMQIIVADDASPEAFPVLEDVEVVRREHNGGFAAAVNSGTERAVGEWLLVLNSDITIGETFVAELLDGAEPWWPAVVSTRVIEDFGERCMGHVWPTARAVVLEHLAPLARFHNAAWFERQMSNDLESVGLTKPRLVDWVTGICMLMPTADVRAVGGLDERYYMNCEEVDLQKRLHADRGLPVVLLPGPVIRHVGGGSSASEKRAGWVLDARMRYYEKWNGGPCLCLGLWAAAVVNFVWNSARTRRGRPVDAREIFRGETTRIRHAWRTRR